REAREELLADLENGRREGKPYDEVLGDRDPGRLASEVGPYYRTYQARDGYMVVACLNNRLRRSVRDLLGVEDPRVDGDQFDVHALEPEAAAALMAHTEAIIATRSVAEWCAEFEKHGVPCGRFALPAEIFEDEHVVATELMLELDHPV